MITIRQHIHNLSPERQRKVFCAQMRLKRMWVTYGYNWMRFRDKLLMNKWGESQARDPRRMYGKKSFMNRHNK